MFEVLFLYTFIGLMAFNILASLVYLYGFEPIKVALAKTFKSQGR